MDDSQRDDIPQPDEHDEIDYLYHRITFLENALVAAAIRNVEMEFESGPKQEIVKRFLNTAIYKGLEIGLFRPDDEAQEMPRPDDGLDSMLAWPNKVPWSVAMEMAAQLGVDADEVRSFFVDEYRERIEDAGKLGPVKERGADVPEEIRTQLQGLADSVADKLARQMAQQMGGADKYMLHCHHDDHACIHGYDSVEELIDSAAAELIGGSLQSVQVVTLNDNVVLDTEQLAKRVNDRIDLMRSARNN